MDIKEPDIDIVIKLNKPKINWKWILIYFSLFFITLGLSIFLSYYSLYRDIKKERINNQATLDDMQNKLEKLKRDRYLQ